MGVEEALAIAMRAHQAADWEMAETLYQRILAVAPAHPGALQLLGMLCSQRGRSEEALRLLSEAVERDPGNSVVHNNLGNVLNSLGRHEEAMSAYQRALSLDDNNTDAYCNVGALLASQGRLQEAVKAYYEAIKCNPGHADTFYHLGRALARLGHDDGAVQAYYRAITANVKHGPAYRALGEAFYRLDRRDEAVGAFAFALYCLGQNERGMAALREWLRLDPDNPRARHTWQAWTGKEIPSRATDDYVRTEFDRYADEFDEHLRELEYHAPDLLVAAIAPELGAATARLRVLDAGCGTGWCGPLLRPHARRLVGVDLSPRMLDKARLGGEYDELVEAELTQFMLDHPEGFDLIVSADTLVYFGDLEPPLRAASTALVAGGILAFTVERLANDKADYHLDPNGRYGHAESYLRRLLAMTGMAVMKMETVVLRLESGQPVTGCLVVARKALSLAGADESSC